MFGLFLLLVLLAFAALLLLPVIAPRVAIFVAVAISITGIGSLLEPEEGFIWSNHEIGWALVALAAIMVVTAVARIFERRKQAREQPPELPPARVVQSEDADAPSAKTRRSGELT